MYTLTSKLTNSLLYPFRENHTRLGTLQEHMLSQLKYIDWLLVSSRTLHHGTQTQDIVVELLLYYTLI